MQPPPTNRPPVSSLRLRLYNTLTNKVDKFVATDPAHVTFYTCGPTVYDDAHIGNFRSFLAADVLRRFLESPLCAIEDEAGEPHARPRRVTHVMNITDVGHMTDDAEGGESGEDRMAVAGHRLLEAKKAGTLPKGVEVNPQDPFEIAAFYEARFKEDACKLGLKVAIEAKTDRSLMPKATDNINGMIAVIKRLVEGKYAYEVGERGSRVVYFDVSKFAFYGQLSGNRLDALREGEGGRVQASHQSQKHNPADFLLWKEDSTHIMKWKSPWGEGYPGWHIECTAMSVSRLVPITRFMAKKNLIDLLRTKVRDRYSSSLLGEYGSLVRTLHESFNLPVKPDKNAKYAASHYIAALISDHGDHDNEIVLYSMMPSRRQVDKWLQSPKSNVAIWSILSEISLPESEATLIDVHSGGEDNIFPHHECEIAQSCCAFNVPSFARMWFHPRFLLVEGTKMSKSKGNFFTARDLFAKGVQAGALRLELIRTHYRANANFTMQGLEDCQRMIDRWRRVVDAHPAEGAGGSSPNVAALREHPLCREVAMALSEDLNVSQAVAAVNAWLNGLASGGGSPTRADADALRMVDGVFGVLALARAQSTQTEIGVFAPGVTPDAKVEELLRARRDARAKKDFAASDKIRDELAAMGFAIKDMAGGKVEVRRG